ncbi:Flagellar trans-acting factor FliX [Caenispirillum salinarum AK4]|uniref:Flagellar trans-acting factor FliX n=1 Tax=Caenispirillum salinarum AK4 TaxID=1238182 RepID=K9HDB2_9PROT|nr:flagellar assembly protein FliX [Caenispirillum salinarum]EKV26706.1 Flagellar trans-acting factor FliX [Caenispirillum salinarum AK4]
MKISGPGPGGGQRRTDKTSKDKSADFARALRRFSAEAKDDAGAQGARASDAPSQVGGLEALLAAQMVDGVDATGDEAGRRKRQAAMLQRGEDILDRLEELRVGLLLGHVPKDRLSGLARLVREQREDAQDPQLAALLDEIELRAEVELAKLERG